MDGLSILFLEAIARSSTPAARLPPADPRPLCTPHSYDRAKSETMTRRFAPRDGTRAVGRVSRTPRIRETVRADAALRARSPGGTLAKRPSRTEPPAPARARRSSDRPPPAAFPHTADYASAHTDHPSPGADFWRGAPPPTLA